MDWPAEMKCGRTGKVCMVMLVSGTPRRGTTSKGSYGVELSHRTPSGVCPFIALADRIVVCPFFYSNPGVRFSFSWYPFENRRFTR